MSYALRTGPRTAGCHSARASGRSQLLCRCRHATSGVVGALLEVGVLGPGAARLLDRILERILLQLRLDGCREIDAGDIGELDEVDRDVGDLLRDALPFLPRLAARLVGRQPLEELEQL